MNKANWAQKIVARPVVFFGLIAILTWVQVKTLKEVMFFEPGNILPYLGLVCFAILALNISLLAVQAIFALIAPKPCFQSVSSEAIQNIHTALIYCTRNESFGVKERIQFTFGENNLAEMHLWILSDSDASFVAAEEKMVEELRVEFGADKVFYRNRKVTYERKQGNVHGWLTRFGNNYEYFIVCDVDSLLPHRWAEQIIRIAEHESNQDIAVFQSAIFVTHEASLYARMQAVGQYYAQKLYFYVNQAVLGRSIAFGHNCLIRRHAFQKIELPAGILSHDNWETALLEQVGYRTVFLPHLISYEEATPHYLEDLKRSRRWLKGTLQGLPLLFLPRVSFSVRFLIFHQIYLYLVQPVLFLWIILGLLGNYLLEMSDPAVSVRVFGLMGVTFTVLLFHQFVVARSWGDVKRIFQGIFYSSLVGLQSVFYGTLNVVMLPLQSLGWKPMAKDPGDRLSFSECVRGLYQGTLLGLLALALGIHFSPSWTLFSIPVLTSLILSIPAVYWSSKGWSAPETIEINQGGFQHEKHYA